MRCFFLLAASAIAITALGADAVRIPPHSFSTCEIQKMADELKPPARFRDYRAQFSYEKIHVALEHKNGPEPMDMWVIRDNGKVVALMPANGFHGGWLSLQTWDPAQTKAEPNIPKERWHCDTQVGSAIRTDHFMPSKEWYKGESNAWHVVDNGATLVLIRQFKGDMKADRSRWELNYGGKVDAVNTFVFRVDPVFGYVIDATWEVGLNPAVKDTQYCSLYPNYISNPWVDTHEMVVASPVGKTGYVGHFNNHAAVGRSSGWTCRNGGFAAYLDTRTGWSPAMPALGANAVLVVCNVHADQDFIVQWPTNLVPDAEGLKHFTYQTRLCWLPPELTRNVREKTEILFAEGRCVMIPVGKLEDFEDQPASVASMKPGMTFTQWPGATISDTEAHSGKKSLQVRGLLWPNLPQLVLKPNQKYRISAWIKVIPPTAEQKEKAKQDFAADVERKKADHAKKMEKLRKAGKEAEVTEFKPPTLDESAEAEAWISGDFYEWTPHNGQRDRPISTTRAKAGEGWKKVSVDFVSDKWGPFSDLAFHCSNGGTAFVDDFFYEEVKE